MQNNTLSRAELSNESGIAKNVHYGDVLIKYGEVLNIGKESLPMITDENILEKYKASFLQNGDVIFADTAEDSTVGKCSEIAGLESDIVLSGLHTIPYRPMINFSSGYLGYYLNSDGYHNQLIPLMQGIKVTSISKSAMQDTKINFPKSKNEQADIGTFFTNLDRLITLHQRKYDKLVNIKKAMLEKMFPKDGAKTPEIRFKGFTDDWEQRKLGECCIEFKSGDTIKAEKILANGKFPVFGGNGLRGYTNQYNHDGEYALIGRQGALCGNMNYSCGKAYFTEHAVAVSANNDFKTRYLYYSLGKMNLGQYSGQSAQPGLAVNRLIELKNIFPRKKEQEKIAKLFTNLDQLITLHQRKLEKLQNIKKACLEKMFV